LNAGHIHSNGDACGFRISGMIYQSRRALVKSFGFQRPARESAFWALQAQRQENATAF
jgi:hypothetical protein